jgi:hypothetical protein
MQRVEDREQEKVIHETVYKGRKRSQNNREAGQKTNKKPVVCDYCGKPNHSVIECRKRMV